MLVLALLALSLTRQCLRWHGAVDVGVAGAGTVSPLLKRHGDVGAAIGTARTHREQRGGETWSEKRGEVATRSLTGLTGTMIPLGGAAQTSARGLTGTLIPQGQRWWVPRVVHQNTKRATVMLMITLDVGDADGDDDGRDTDGSRHGPGHADVGFRC